MKRAMEYETRFMCCMCMAMMPMRCLYIQKASCEMNFAGRKRYENFCA